MMLEIPFTKVQSLEEIIFLAEDKHFTSGDMVTSKKANRSMNFSDMMLSKKQSRAEISRIKHCESLDDIEQPSKLEECSQCKVWKRWAAKQQRMLVEIQAKLVQRQLHLSRQMQNLKKQLQNKNAIIKEFQRIITGLQQHTWQMCQKQIQKGQCSYQQPAYQPLNTTSSKIKVEYKAMTKISSSTMLQELLPKEQTNKWQLDHQNQSNEPIKNKATDKFGWSTAAPTIQKKLYQHQSHNLATDIDRYFFENTILKEYNKTLLSKIKESKFAKLKL